MSDMVSIKIMTGSQLWLARHALKFTACEMMNWKLKTTKKQKSCCFNSYRTIQKITCGQKSETSSKHEIPVCANTAP